MEKCGFFEERILQEFGQEPFVKVNPKGSKTLSS